MLVKTNESMSPECFAPIDDLCQDFIARCVDELDGPGFELYGAHGYDPERIENKACSGFIPYTDGGWIATIPGDISSAQGSGIHSGLLSGEIERLEIEARASWLDDDNPDPWEIEDDDTREEWYEHEREWLESVYFVDVHAIYFNADNRSNRSGKPEVYFVASVNFDEYGRDKHSITLWDKGITVDDLSPEMIPAIVDEAMDAIAACRALESARG